MAYSNVTPPTLPDYNPVSGYSYNGTVLPKLPEWDEEKYPYVALQYLAGEGSTIYVIGYSEKPTTSIQAITKSVVHGVDTGVSYITTYYYEPEGWYSDAEESANGHRIGIDNFIWANYDILNTDGTTYLAASDPVPIEPYPYSVIAYNYEKGAEDWYQAHLYYSATPFTWNGTAVVNSGTTYKRIYDAELDAWTDDAETEIEATPGLDGTVYQRIYTDHDILDSTGAVWLAAGQVTPVEETGVSDTWKYSFKLGLALGLCGKPLPIVRKLIGYSYNGTVLPKLPEWDKITYPYAVIGKVSNYPDVYILVMGENAPTYSGDTEKVTIAMTNTNEPLQIAKCVSPYSAWGGVEDWSYYMCNFWTDLYWTNTDILSTDGTLYLATSDPVPVYK